MKRRIIPFIPLLLLLSCDESVQPKTDFVEQPILYGIATSSSLGDITQKIILSRTFDVDGLQIPDTSSDRGIPGAVVEITTGGRIIALQESLFVFRNADGSLTNRLMYTSPPFRFGPQQALSVRAMLPDGRTLTAEPVSPPFFFFESSHQFARGITTTVRNNAGDAWTIRWQNLPAHLFWPALTIQYDRLLADSTRRTGVMRVPLTYTKQSGRWEAMYPQQTWEPSTSFTFDAIDSAMARLSEGEPDKSRFRVLSATFSVTAYDPHLARYHTSIYGSGDEYSIRSDPAFYSNVNGGIGVFGSQTVSSFIYLMDPLYVRSFGYQSSG